MTMPSISKSRSTFDTQQAIRDFQALFENNEASRAQKPVTLKPTYKEYNPSEFFSKTSVSMELHSNLPFLPTKLVGSTQSQNANQSSDSINSEVDALKKLWDDCERIPEDSPEKQAAEQKFSQLMGDFFAKHSDEIKKLPNQGKSPEINCTREKQNFLKTFRERYPNV